MDVARIRCPRKGQRAKGCARLGGWGEGVKGGAKKVQWDLAVEME